MDWQSMLTCTRGLVTEAVSTQVPITFCSSYFFLDNILLAKLAEVLAQRQFGNSGVSLPAVSISRLGLSSRNVFDI